MVETCNLENWWERWLRFNLYNTASIHTKRGSSEHQNRYSINFKARISICPSDSEMSSETNALEAKGGVGREERWEASGRGGGKERANGEKGRERPSEISICRGWQNGSRRHELPRHVEFVTALFALRVRRKKKRKDRGYRSEVWLDARAHTHTRTHTPRWYQVSVDFRCAESKLRYIVSELKRRAPWISTRFLSISHSFHRRSSLSRRLPPSPSRFPFHAIDFPLAKRKNVSSATPIHHWGGEELNFAAWISRWNDDLRVQIRLRRLQ